MIQKCHCLHFFTFSYCILLIYSYIAIYILVLSCPVLHCPVRRHSTALPRATSPCSPAPCTSSWRARAVPSSLLSWPRSNTRHCSCHRLRAMRARLWRPSTTRLCARPSGRMPYLQLYLSHGATARGSRNQTRLEHASEFPQHIYTLGARLHASLRASPQP
jgi:hypothetical protein